MKSAVGTSGVMMTVSMQLKRDNARSMTDKHPQKLKAWAITAPAYDQSANDCDSSKIFWIYRIGLSA